MRGYKMNDMQQHMGPYKSDGTIKSGGVISLIHHIQVERTSLAMVFAGTIQLVLLSGTIP